MAADGEKARINTCARSRKSIFGRSPRRIPHEKSQFPQPYFLFNGPTERLKLLFCKILLRLCVQTDGACFPVKFRVDDGKASERLHQILRRRSPETARGNILHSWACSCVGADAHISRCRMHGFLRNAAANLRQRADVGIGPCRITAALCSPAVRAAVRHTKAFSAASPGRTECRSRRRRRRRRRPPALRPGR